MPAQYCWPLQLLSYPPGVDLLDMSEDEMVVRLLLPRHKVRGGGGCEPGGKYDAHTQPPRTTSTRGAIVPSDETVLVQHAMAGVRQ